MTCRNESAFFAQDEREHEDSFSKISLTMEHPVLHFQTGIRYHLENIINLKIGSDYSINRRAI